MKSTGLIPQGRQEALTVITEIIIDSVLQTMIELSTIAFGAGIRKVVNDCVEILIAPDNLIDIATDTTFLSSDDGVAALDSGVGWLFATSKEMLDSRSCFAISNVDFSKIQIIAKSEDALEKSNIKKLLRLPLEMLFIHHSILSLHASCVDWGLSLIHI